MLAAAVLAEPMAAADDLQPLPTPTSMDGDRRCNDVLRRWREFGAEMAAGYGDAWRQGMAAGYPSPELTLKFIKWLLTTRKQQSRRHFDNFCCRKVVVIGAYGDRSVGAYGDLGAYVRYGNQIGESCRDFGAVDML